MSYTLVLTIIGIVLMSIGIIFNLNPKKVNKALNHNIHIEAENIAASLRTVIGSLAFTIGFIAFASRSLPENSANTILYASTVGFINTAITIISSKFRGFDKKICPGYSIFLLLSLLAVWIIF